jgi:SET domain-containing protein
MLSIEQIQKDINELPEEAQALLIDFIDLLKKRYSVVKKPEVNSNQPLNHQLSTLDILKESGLIGCISAEPDLSNHYKFALQEELDSKYDNC